MARSTGKNSPADCPENDMELMRSVTEVGEAINRARAGADTYIANFFPAPHKIQQWIARSELYCNQEHGATLFLRKDRDFWHLYFCATDLESLRFNIAGQRELRTEPVVLDLVGKEQAIARQSALFELAGFRLYNRLFRMARFVPAAITRTDEFDPNVSVANAGEVQAILDLLLQSFDRRAEQIPMPYEIEAAVAAHQILVFHQSRDDGELAGLLYYETHGLTSTIRYWLVTPEFRGKNFGSRLMHTYFAKHPGVCRFLLWVLAGNDSAIAGYQHYGFAADGLVDLVLTNGIGSP